MMIRTPPRNGHHWAGIWGSGKPDEAVGPVLVDDSIRFLGKAEVHPVGAGGGWGAVRWDNDLERDQRERAEISLGRGQDVQKFAQNVAQAIDHRRRPASTMETEGGVAWVRWKAVPKV